jgi:hypothetical protein
VVREDLKKQAGSLEKKTERGGGASLWGQRSGDGGRGGVNWVFGVLRLIFRFALRGVGSFIDFILVKSVSSCRNFDIKLTKRQKIAKKC